MELNEMSKEWIDFILDMKNLNTSLPDKEDSFCLLLYGKKIDDESAAAGCFCNGKNLEACYETIAQFLKDNPALAVIFFSSILKAISFKTTDMQKSFFNLFKSTINSELLRIDKIENNDICEQASKSMEAGEV
jgi:hypothetical protein